MGGNWFRVSLQTAMVAQSGSEVNRLLDRRLVANLGCDGAAVDGFEDVAAPV